MIVPAAPRVVLLTAIYPPDHRVGELRPAKLVARLRGHGYAVDVVTVAGPAGTRTGDAGETIHVVRPHRTLRERYASSRSAPVDESGGPLPTSSSPRRLRRESWRSVMLGTLRAPFMVPDLERGLILPMAARARELLREGPCVLYSTAPPHSTSVAARLALRGLGTPWVAEFRDPWTDGGYVRNPRRTALQLALNRRLERLVTGRADRLVAVSEGIGTWLAERAPTTPVVVSRNGIDHIVADPPPATPGPLVAVYLGEIYLGRDPRQLFDALRTLRQRGELAAFAPVIRLVGDVMEFRGAPTAELVREYQLDDVVELSGRVPRPEALDLQRRASLLLLFAQQQPLQIPNKVYEYLGTRKPILAFADEGGETAHLLRSVGGHFVITEATRPDDVLHLVLDALAAAVRGEPAGRPDRLADLAAAPQLDRAVAVVDELCRGGDAPEG